MEEPALALVLEKCLAAMERGSDPKAAAGRYPALEDEILPLLQVAAMLRESRDSYPVRAGFLRDLGTRLRGVD